MLVKHPGQRRVEIIIMVTDEFINIVTNNNNNEPKSCCYSIPYGLFSLFLRWQFIINSVVWTLLP